jgi:VIT1/CCC1 family predicted Fe2+/Mn2+ transporter
MSKPKTRWVDVMVREKYKFYVETKLPLSKGLMTYISFVMVGFIPLFIYILDLVVELEFDLFLISSILTGLCFIIIGFLKAKINESSLLKGIFETLLLGLIAASVAYVVGDFLENLIS